MLESPPCVGRWDWLLLGILDEMARVLAAPTPWPVLPLRVRARCRRRVPGGGPVWESDPRGKAPGYPGRERARPSSGVSLASTITRVPR